MGQPEARGPLPLQLTPSGGNRLLLVRRRPSNNTEPQKAHMPTDYAAMLASPGLSEAQRASILKMQARRAQREAVAAAGRDGAASSSADGSAATGRVRVSFLQPCWLTPWNLVTKMLAKRLAEPLELALPRQGATVAELRAKLESATGVSALRQRLYACGGPAGALRPLPRGGTLREAGLWEGAAEGGADGAAAVWLAAAPGAQPGAAPELEEQVRCQLVAAGGLQLSYDTDLFTRPEGRAAAADPP